MFFTKLFLALVLVLLIGQQLSADPVNDVHRPGNVPQARPSTTEPPVAPSGSSNLCSPPYDADHPDAEDHVNYVLTNGRDYYVGMGPLNRPRQHLQIIAIIAHLKAANEKPVYFPTDTARYEKLANSLIAGQRITLVRLDEPLASAGQSLLWEAILFRVFLVDLNLIPNLNSEVPVPDLEHFLALELIEKGKQMVEKWFWQSLDLPHQRTFDWKEAEAEATNAILEFKQSQFTHWTS